MEESEIDYDFDDDDDEEDKGKIDANYDESSATPITLSSNVATTF
jgi:hypothetical protein